MIVRIPLLPFIGAAFCFGAAAHLWYSRFVFKWRGADAVGQIFDVRRVIGSHREPHDFAMVRFQTPSGQAVEFQSLEDCDPRNIGQSVNVRYLPSNPHKAETEKGLQEHSFKTIAGFLLGGLLCLSLGMVPILIAKGYLNYGIFAGH